MNILFLTLLSFDSLQERTIYTDLLREFVKDGHHVYAISPVERREKKKTHIIKETNSTILRLQIGNTQKTGIIEKGISTVMIEPTFKKAIKRFFSDVKFDLVLYSTPPITLTSVIRWVKHRDRAKSYLLLKDIFPQNALDLGMLSKSGIKGLIYRFFRLKEKKLYALSDKIGCMSQANVDYVLKHNPTVPAGKVEICPNCIEVQDLSAGSDERRAMRDKYAIPQDKIVFVYGGNLGKPQGVPFLIECLKSQESNKNAFFLIVGNGTEYPLLEKYFSKANPENMKLMSQLPKDDYDRMVAACDVGMIFLDHRFTIPNFPSRLLSYMQAGLPVLACTDPNTDIGKVIVEGGFGWWCESNDRAAFDFLVDRISGLEKEELIHMGSLGYSCMTENYNSESAYKTIIDNFGQ